MNRPQSRIVLTKELVEDFYNDGRLLDYRYTNDNNVWGMHLSDFMSAPDQWWEHCHCFIQILFPNPTPSKMNPDAPVIEDFSVFNGVFYFNVCLAVNRFMKFLGIGVLTSTYTDYDRIGEWFRPDNHNILRVTRLLIFLKGVGMIAELNALKEFLKEYHSNIKGVTFRNSMNYTMTIWQNV